MSQVFSTTGLLAGLVLSTAGTAFAWLPGTYPVAPETMVSRGLGVNIKSRNDVVAFWHAVYMASEGYPKRINWTGNYTGNAGTTSAAFVKDVERRLNYFRAMCGVPSTAEMNSGSKVVISADDLFKASSTATKVQAAQESALLLVRNYDPTTGYNLANTHNPAPTLTGWTNEAWNGSAKGNIGFGVYGPGAVTEYMVESLTATTGFNTEVGHRRWLIFPKSTDFATGDQPGKSAMLPPTNTIYIMQSSAEWAPSVTAKFATYPPAGFTPALLNSPYWSISYPGADFSAANVTVTKTDGTLVPITGKIASSGYGDPALIWKVEGGADVRYVYSDTSYNVNVSGIAGAAPSTSFDYQVTLINPNRLTSNQNLIGSSLPKAARSTAYTFTPPPGAEGLQVECLKQLTTKWTEGAQDLKIAKIIADAGGNYNLFCNPSTYVGFSQLSGTKAFRLTFPNSYNLLTRGVPEQSFEIDREIIPRSNAKLTFLFRRGYMSKGSKLNVEISKDAGVSWKAISTISGVSDTNYDNALSPSSLPLVASATPIRIRFRYYSTGGGIYTHESAPTFATGIFLDDISCVNCDELVKSTQISVAKTATSFQFKDTTAGSKLVAGQRWQLRLRTKLGGRTFIGPSKVIKVVSP